LISALGAGSVLGAGTLALATWRRRFTLPLVVGAFLASVPFAMTSLSPGLQSAWLWLVAAGVGKGMLDVIGRTAMQRRLGSENLAAAFGFQECVSHLALACGALFSLPLVATFGARGAFVASASVLPTLCLVAAISNAGRGRGKSQEQNR
jgi:predicted MFS family arabinose efflux permease